MAAKPKDTALSLNAQAAALSQARASAVRQARASAVERLTRAFPGRDGLGAYLEEPAAYPPSLIIFHDDNLVAIHDKFPKSVVHALLLPRSKKHNRLHPFEAFDDPQFLAIVRAGADRLKGLVAGELRRKLGQFSAADIERNSVLNGSTPDPRDRLPDGRDWAREIQVGIHANPSMNHLHVHVISRDMTGPSMKRKNHYQSFNTPFLVPLDDFPLAKDDPRRYGGHYGMDSNLLCWRPGCKKDFGKHGLEELKRHLAVEFDEWKKE